MTAINTGLEGVIVGATAISQVDGEQGRLSYRGQPIDTLVTQPFAKVAWLLLFGRYPSAQQEQQLAHFLLAHRPLAHTDSALLAQIPTGTHPMLMLQAMVPLLDLAPRDEITLPTTQEAAREGLIIAARLPTLIAAYYRREQGLDWPLTSHNLNPHHGFLKSLHGESPHANDVTVLEQAQILQLEHSYNAGTFAGRVVLSTQAPLASSISASIGTLFGRLHGGADEAALTMAQALAGPEDAAAFVSAELAAGHRIMGMGHREYQTLDPRAAILKPLARAVCSDAESVRLLDTLEAIERACTEQLAQASSSGRIIRANVEFYKGAVFHALGIPPRYFTAVFAMARVFGYVAHALEFTPQARLIRPTATYIGE
jgi:citrate synthase